MGVHSGFDAVGASGCDQFLSALPVGMGLSALTLAVFAARTVMRTKGGGLRDRRLHCRDARAPTASGEGVLRASTLLMSNAPRGGRQGKRALASRSHVKPPSKVDDTVMSLL